MTTTTTSWPAPRRSNWRRPLPNFFTNASARNGVSAKRKTSRPKILSRKNIAESVPPRAIQPARTIPKSKFFGSCSTWKRTPEFNSRKVSRCGRGAALLPAVFRPSRIGKYFAVVQARPRSVARLHHLRKGGDPLWRRNAGWGPVSQLTSLRVVKIRPPPPRHWRACGVAHP